MDAGGFRPNWKNLQGDFRTPLKEFVGKFDSYTTPQNRWGGIQIAIKLNQVQVLQSDAFYPQATAEISIKYSERESSAWGIFGTSAAKALGIEVETLEVDYLKNQILHLIRTDNYPIGKDKEGKEMKGTVWEVVEILKPRQKA